MLRPSVTYPLPEAVDPLLWRHPFGSLFKRCEVLVVLVFCGARAVVKVEAIYPEMRLKYNLFDQAFREVAIHSHDSTFASFSRRPRPSRQLQRSSCRTGTPRPPPARR